MLRLTATLSLIAVAVLTACDGGRQIEKVDETSGAFLRVLRGDKSELLDPHATNSGSDADLLQQMYERLVKASREPPVTWEPGLAESFENEDFRVWTFRLRSGVKFHDGSVLDAAAVKKSFERIIVEDHPARPVKRPYKDEYFGDIEDIATPDESTVVFTLTGPNPKFIVSIGLFSAGIVSPKAIDTMAAMDSPSKRQSWLMRHSAGTGPYRIAREEDYRNAETITMTAFEDYWGGAPAIERVVFTSNKDQKHRREQILAGSVHVTTSLAGADWKMLRDDENVVLYTWKAENLCYLGMNCDPDGPHITKNLDVRKAIALAIDRDPIVASYDGAAVPHHVLLPPVTLGFPKGYKPSTDIGPRPERLDKARKLIADAGADGAHLKLLMPDVPRPYLGKPAAIADLIRQQLAEIGLTVTLEPRSMSELVGELPAGTYPLVLLGWMGETGEPDDFWTPLLSGRGKPSDNNVPRFYDAGVEKRVLAARNERDRATRQSMYEELERTVHEQFRPMVPLLSAQQSYAWRSDVEGIHVDSTGVYRLHEARFKQ
jgi:peptide/nickel transport system substrate-binding protein